MFFSKVGSLGASKTNTELESLADKTRKREGEAKKNRTRALRGLTHSITLFSDYTLSPDFGHY